MQKLCCRAPRHGGPPSCVNCNVRAITISSPAPTRSWTSAVRKLSRQFFAAEKPEYVFLAAAKVGGIVANQKALADFMYDQHDAGNERHPLCLAERLQEAGVPRLVLHLSAHGSAADEGKLPADFRTGKTNEAYALAKISGLKYCEFLNRQYGTDYISVMPTNLYGPNDNYHPTHSHVVPALIRRFHEAKVNGVESVTCWGDGSPLREFLYVDDLATSACS